MVYKQFGAELMSQVKQIYAENGWNAYLGDDRRLISAFEHSLYALGAFDGDTLVGFVRCLGDGEYMVLVQDLIVRKSYQKRGIGTHLFRTAWEHYGDVRMFHVVTDISDPVDNRFYQSFGMKKLAEGDMVSYFR